MNNIEKLFEIKCLTHTIFNDNTNLKLLFFINKYQPTSPHFLIKKLGIVKSNLANATKQLQQEKLIIVNKQPQNQRSIFYSATDLGKQKLDNFFKSCNLSINQEQDENLELLLNILNNYI